MSQSLVAEDDRFVKIIFDEKMNQFICEECNGSSIAAFMEFGWEDESDGDKAVPIVQIEGDGQQGK